MRNVNIQVLSRAKKYEDALEDIEIVYRAIHGTAGWNLPNIDGFWPDYLVMFIEAIQTPYYLGVEENRRHEFSCNFIFRMEEAVCGGESPSPSP